MPTVIPFPRKIRCVPSVPLAGQSNLVRLILDLNATYNTVAEVVKDDPRRRDQLRDLTKAFMGDIARIGGQGT